MVEHDLKFLPKKFVKYSNDFNNRTYMVCKLLSIAH